MRVWGNQLKNSRTTYFGFFKIPLPVYFVKVFYQQEHEFEGDSESPETHYSLPFWFACCSL